MYQEFYYFLLTFDHGMAELFEKTGVITTRDENIYEEIIDYLSNYGILYETEVTMNRGKEFILMNLVF